MIKCNTLGMYEVCKNNPVLKSDSDVANYSFITVDGDLYLIANTLTGDDAGKEDVTIKAGEFLNGFLVEAWKGQELVIDAKHISTAYASLTAGTTVLVADTNGKLKSGSAPSAGAYFKVTEKCYLTGDAVKAKVMVA